MSLICAPSTSTCWPEAKTKMQAVVGVMRKLSHAIYGMFKHNQPFEGSKVYRIPEHGADRVAIRPTFSTTEAA